VKGFGQRSVLNEKPHEEVKGNRHGRGKGKEAEGVQF
jgi:hypothetical protein